MMRRIDFHAHFLPECDHGSDGTETSLKQICLAVDANIDIMCATPHFYPERENTDVFLRRREQSYAALKSLLPCTSPDIILGAEVLCFEGIEKLPDISKLCFAKDNILLLEMPFNAWSDGLIDSVEKLSRLRGIKVVLAHIDRYRPDVIDELLSFGLLAQLNVDSCADLVLEKKFKKWIEDGYVVAWGSDIHGTDIGYKNWKKCSKRRGTLWDTVMERTNELFLI